jgi:recombination protein RecA
VLYQAIKKSGNSYSFGEVKLGVGRESAKTFLKENLKVIKEIEKEILKLSKENPIIAGGGDTEE